MPKAIQAIALKRKVASRSRPRTPSGVPKDRGCALGEASLRRGSAASRLAPILENRARFFAAAMRVVGDREAADDVLQIALLKALERSGTVRDPSGILPWFSQVLRNTAVDYTRRRQAYQRALEQAALLGGAGVGELDERAGAGCGCIDEATKTLKSTYAAMVRRVDLEGRSLAEAALAERVTRTNARVRLHRARKMLRARVLAMCAGSPLERCRPCGCESARRSPAA